MGGGRRARRGAGPAIAGLAVLALLAVVAAASRSGAVAFGGASAQVRGTVEIAWPFVLVAVGAAFMTTLLGGNRLWRLIPRQRSKPALRAETVLVILILVAIFSLGAMFVIAARSGHRLQPRREDPALIAAERHRHHAASAKRQRHFELPDGAVVWLLAAGAVGGAAAVALRRRRLAAPPERGRLELAADLDDALADLRGERDVRAAIVALYRRMLGAFALLGIERTSSEAPREYLARALASLDVPAEPASRLTGLFEEARFSTHRLGDESRAEAVGALADVRDALRGATGAAA